MLKKATICKDGRLLRLSDLSGYRTRGPVGIWLFDFSGYRTNNDPIGV